MRLIPSQILRSLRLACVALCMHGSECLAQTMALPAGTQFPLFAKILSYDRQLNQRANGAIVVGVLYQSRFHLSMSACDKVLSAIQNGPVKTISGIPVRAVPIDVNFSDNMEDAIAASGANVLYVTPLRSIDIDDIRAITGRLRLVSMTGVPEYVAEGIALGIDVSDERPLILINVRAAAEEGADLSSQVLKVAKIIQ